MRREPERDGATVGPDRGPGRLRAASRARRAIVAGLAGLTPLLPLASAQTSFSGDPFFAHAQELSAAYGSELLAARLEALGAIGDPDEETIEEIAQGLEGDLRRFAGGLAARDAELAGRLDEAVEGIGRAAEAEDARAAVAAVEEALAPARAARETVVPTELRADPAFTAALLTLMLTSEGGGIGEAYEEAVEGEAAAYATGWAALARVRELWAGLEPLASDVQRFEIEDMLADLEGLFPGPLPGPEVARSDPEEAEGSTMRMAGFLEELADASVFPQRDLGRLAGLTRDLAGSGCEARAAGDAVGDDRLYAAAFLYGEYLAGTASLLAPEPAAGAAAAFDELAPGGLGEEEEEEGADADDAEGADPDDEAAAAPPEACAALLDALEGVGNAFGG